MGTNITYGVYFRKMEIFPVFESVFTDKTSFHIKQLFHYMALAKLCNL